MPETPHRKQYQNWPALEFSEKLINIAKMCIPHNPTTHKRDRPWFRKECKQAICL